jgi:hypothetical protein
VGNAKLTVSSLTVPSGFSTDFSSWSSKSLEPNESHTFKVTFKPTEVKDYSGKMVLKSNASNAPEASFTIGGKGVAVPEAKLKVSKTYLEFDETIVGQSSQLEWTITNVGNITLTVSSLTVPSGFSTDFSSWSSKSLEPNESHTFKVTFKPTEVKDYSGKMVLKSNASNAQEASFTIGGKGIEEPGKPEISADPASLSFGHVTLGKQGKLSVSIINNGGSQLKISSLTCLNGFTTNFDDWPEKTIPAHGQRTLNVVFAPSEEKVYNGNIVIKSNASNKTYFTIPIYGVGEESMDISYYGEYVDLGLSVLWATCNLGGRYPSDRGAFYGWGETTPRNVIKIDFKDYKWYSNGKYTKYNWSSEDGPVDYKYFLDREDDAASNHLGGDWRMPTEMELEELMRECEWTYTANYQGTGVSGCIVRGKKEGYTNNHIFLPDGTYHSSTLSHKLGIISGPYAQEGMCVGKDYMGNQNNENTRGRVSATCYRLDAHLVRPVKGPRFALQYIPGDLDFGSVAVGSTSTKTATIKNTGERTVDLYLSAREPFFVGEEVDWWTLLVSLKPGESKSIPISFSPKERNTYDVAGRFQWNGLSGFWINLSGTGR